MIFYKNILPIYVLTMEGKTRDRPTDTNLPHAAPVNNDGIKSPLDVANPKVQQESIK